MNTGSRCESRSERGGSNEDTVFAFSLVHSMSWQVFVKRVGRASLCILMSHHSFRSTVPWSSFLNKGGVSILEYCQDCLRPPGHGPHALFMLSWLMWLFRPWKPCCIWIYGPNFLPQLLTVLKSVSMAPQESSSQLCRKCAVNWLCFNNVSLAVILNLCSEGYCFVSVKALSFKQG